MQEGEIGAPTGTRRGHSVARRLFQDQDQDRNQDHNNDPNNDVGSGVEDNLTNRLSEEARKDLATAETRWNFDFVNERPLAGRWDWVKVGNAARDAPESADRYFSDNEEEKTDQREKSETEANEKDDNNKGGKD